MNSVGTKIKMGLHILPMLRRHQFQLLRNCHKLTSSVFVKQRTFGHCQRCISQFNSSSARQFSSKSTEDSNFPNTEPEAADLLDGATLSNSSREIPDFPSDVHRYKSEAERRRSQRKHRIHPKIDAEDTSILLFPGQGSQFQGMGKELLEFPNVDHLYSVASEILGYDLLNLCINGPIEKLNRTEYCQPAVLVTSLAAVEKLKHTQPWAIEHCITTAGFSIGEYAALVFAGSMGFEDAVRVVKVRAQLMQEASEAAPSGMMTVFLGPRSKLKLACRTAKQYCMDRADIEKPVCEVANYLYPECKVIAGNMQALDFIEANAKEFSLLKTKRVPVSGAFHTPLMESASRLLKKEIQKIDISTPLIPVHSNVNGFKHRHPGIIEKLLVQQVCKPVKWEQTMHVLYSREPGAHFPFTFEVGPGKQLGAVLGKVNRKALKQYEAVTV